MDILTSLQLALLKSLERNAPKQSDSRRPKSHNLYWLCCHSFRCSESTDKHAGMCLVNQMSQTTCLIQQFSVKNAAFAFYLTLSEKMALQNMSLCIVCPVCVPVIVLFCVHFKISIYYLCTSLVLYSILLVFYIYNISTFAMLRVGPR